MNRSRSAESRGVVRVFEQAPATGLRPFIRRFLVVEFPFPHSDIHLPNTGPVAAFSFRGECRLGDGRRVAAAAITGVHRTARAHEHRDGHAVLLALFTPAGASAFLPLPLEEIAGMTAGLADLLGPSCAIDRLQEEIAVAPNHARRVEALQEFLFGRLGHATPDPLVAAAVAWLERETETASRRIDALVRHIGLSQSALERRFRRVVGVSPRRFASLVRLERAVHLHATGLDLTAVAQAAGYYDQSHFIHDFREVTGRPPAAFLRALRES